MQQNTNKKYGFKTIQVMIWIVAYLAIFFYSFFKFEKSAHAFVYSILVTGIYIVTVYGNSHFLIPSFYKQKVRYLFYSVLFIIIVIGIRMLLEYGIMNQLMNYYYFFYFSHEHFSFSSVTTIFAFFFGALFRIALNHFELLQREQERQSQQTAAELQLLKSQVQPHFLFNALNNIYYLAYTKSDQAPVSIERLSDIMRYFVEEAPKEWIVLDTEIEFIKDYIEIEKVRLPYGLELCLRSPKPGQSILIPPMLFIPLVENVFKHGIDRSQKINKLSIDLSLSGNKLIFIVKNSIHQSLELQESFGTGLVNLKRRLSLIYEENYTLETKAETGCFTATLKIPLN
jgi:LytS/YehU family sensor histidine kinase